MNSSDCFCVCGGVVGLNAAVHVMFKSGMRPVYCVCARACEAGGLRLDSRVL